MKNITYFLVACAGRVPAKIKMYSVTHLKTVKYTDRLALV